MKVLLQIVTSSLALCSCVETSQNQFLENLSVEEMKCWVEVEEIHFEKEPVKPRVVRNEAPLTEENLHKGELKGGPPIKFDGTVCGPKASLNEGVVKIPDEDAQFPGGFQDFKKFVASNLTYPNNQFDYQGTVYVYFIVESDGCITNAKIIRGISEELDEEALRLVGSMPNWIPAKKNGKVVATDVRLPIRFALN